jgi:hypothetical protein
MKRYLLSLFLCVTLSHCVAAQIGNGEIEAMLAPHRAKNEALVVEMSAKAKAEVDKLLAATRTRIQELKNENEGQYADELTGYLNRIESAPTPFEALDEAAAPMPSIPTGIHEHVVILEDEILKFNKDYAPKVDRNQALMLKAAKQYWQRQEKLNPQAAATTRKFYLDLLAVPSPKFDDQLPTIPTDPEEARVVWKRFQAEMKTATDSYIRREMWSLFAKLYELRQTAKADANGVLLGRIDEVGKAFLTEENLDQAFARMKQEDRNRNLLSGVPNWAVPRGWLEINRKKLEGKLWDVLEPHTVWCEARVKKHNKVISELNKRWAPFNSKELKDLIASNPPYAELRRAIEKQFKLLDEPPVWLRDPVHVPLPESTPQVTKLLQEFDLGAAKRLEAANQADAAERLTLITLLERAKDADSIEESGRLDVLKVLKSDYGVGLRGLLVVDVDERSSDEVREAVTRYLEKGLKRLADLTKKHESALAECRTKLKSARSAFLSQADFEGLLLLETHLYRREHPLPPIWIRVNSSSNLTRGPQPYDWSRPMRLFSRRGNEFLVEAFGVNFEWMPRHHVLLGWNEIIESAEDVVRKNGAYAKWGDESKLPPSQPLDDSMHLAVGDKVIVDIGRFFETLPVSDVSPFGVVVERDPGGASSRLDVFPRPAVRKVK